ncbi:hypothetical protein [Methanosarcina sp. UBA5]|uniref:hypothetical protein n=1 Tax=Methanosarcina sp. UBA5 TaxID=1915593 RepID=UPI0025F1A478|nr:hypothetical protein [Methanosarcina sp. UBA5]
MQNLKAVDTVIPFKAVHAPREKGNKGGFHHFGTFPELEDQMCAGYQGQKSHQPDRCSSLCLVNFKFKCVRKQ